MQKSKRAVLLVGSPKGSDSTSNALGAYLLDRLENKGLVCNKVMINQSLRTPENQTAMFQLIDNSDLIILAFPLYADCLHSQVIKTLEIIANHEKGRSNLTRKNFVAIAKSGFPEAIHNNLAIRVCQNFARQVGFAWAGGLAMGGGGMISGRSLQEIKGMARNQLNALDIAADALANGETIPEEAVESMSKLVIPRWMYSLFSNRAWKQQAKNFKAIKQIYNQPFK